MNSDHNCQAYKKRKYVIQFKKTKLFETNKQTKPVVKQNMNVTNGEYWVIILIGK